jgi:hypothetical protein
MNYSELNPEELGRYRAYFWRLITFAKPEDLSNRNKKFLREFGKFLQTQKKEKNELQN